MANQEKSRAELEQEVQELRERLEVAEETLRAITQGEVDALVVSGAQGEQNKEIIAARTAQLVQVNTQLQQELRSRQKVEEALQENQSLLNSIIEGTTDIIAALDLDYRYIAFNNAYKAEFLKIFGREIEIGTSLIEVLAHLPEEQAKVAQIWGRALAGEEFTIIQEFGDTAHERNYYEITYSSIRDNNGQRIGASHIAKNVRDRLATEQVLRESEERFRNAFDYAAIGMALVALDGRWLKVNHSLCEITGYSEQELLATTFQSITHPDDLDADLAYANQLLKGEIRSYQMEKRYFHKQGHILWILLNGCLVRDHQGQPLYFIAQIKDITERKRSEEALRESEEKLKAILDNVPGFVYLKDLQGRHLMVNRYCLDAFHITSEQLIGKTNAEFFPPEIAQRVEANDREVLQTGMPCQYEEEVLLDDGIHTQYSVKFPLLDASGKPYAICGISTDISDRIRTQKALQESEERLQLALEGSGDGFWDWNIATGKVYYSPRYLEMLGYEVGDFPEDVDSWAKLIHPDDQLRVMKILEAHLKDSSVPYSFDYRLLTKSGEWKWIADYGKVVVRDENGKPLRMAGTHKDISDRKLAEKELELQAVITKNIAEGICLVRADNAVIVYANPKFESLFGYNPGELNGKHVSIVNYADESMSAEEVNQAIRREVLQHGEATYEVHNVKKDGTPFWCRATTSIFDHPEYGTVLVAVHQDITEHKQAEDLIKASLKEKEVLLKEIHHRVKNNLQIVTSLLQMQSRRTKEPQAVEVLRDSKNRIASIALVHEKLYRSEDLANIDFGQYIPDLTTHLFDTYNVSSNTVSLNLHVENTLLQIDEAIPCGLIINELVSNSLKYAFPAKRKGKIQIKFYSTKSDNNLTLIVRDNGMGIPKEFDIETTHSLGLTLVQGLVEQLEGTIELDRHQGTEFKITFPGGKI
jgi:PAS domain S-box-containing protein